MCVSHSRKCQYCGFIRQSSCQRCTAYWEQYKIALKTKSDDEGPVSAECDYLDNVTSSFDLGRCPLLRAGCPSQPIYEEFKEMRYSYETYIAKLINEKDHYVQLYKERFAQEHFAKQSVPPHVGTGSLLTAAYEGLNLKMSLEEKTPALQDPVQHALKPFDSSGSSTLVDLASNESTLVESRAEKPLGGYSMKRESRTKSRLRTQRTKEHYQSKGIAAESFVSTPYSEGSLSQARIWTRNVTFTPANSPTKTEAAKNSSSANNLLYESDSTDSNGIPPEFLNAVDSDDDTASVRRVGYLTDHSNDGEDSPLFPLFLGSGLPKASIGGETELDDDQRVPVVSTAFVDMHKNKQVAE